MSTGGNGKPVRVEELEDGGRRAFEFALPPDAPHGQYTLRARIGDTFSERTVTVGDYELPAFRVTLETDRDYYAPGDEYGIAWNDPALAIGWPEMDYLLSDKDREFPRLAGSRFLPGYHGD